MKNLLESAAKNDHPQNSQRYRIVVDTSLLISGLFWFGAENRVLRHIFASHQVILSQYIIDELLDFCDDVLPKVSRRQKREIQAILGNFVYQTSESTPNRIRDLADEPIISLALQYNAIIISSDKDFLEYKPPKPVILSPKDYLEINNIQG